MKNDAIAVATDAYKRAFMYEDFRGENGMGCCAQPVLRALREAYNEQSTEGFKALTGFSAGGGNLCDGMCGAYAGAIYYISEKTGRSMDDVLSGKPGATDKCFESVAKLHEKFVGKYGSVICYEIQRKLYGRPYYITDPDEFEKFDAKGAHDWAETGVCGDAAKFAVEVLEGIE